jgi:hypothetical protein
LETVQKEGEKRRKFKEVEGAAKKMGSSAAVVVDCCEYAMSR